MTDILERHGTEAFELTPASVLAAAEADIKRWHRNQKRDFGSHHDDYEHYAFHRIHVRKVMRGSVIARAIDIVRYALKHRDDLLMTRQTESGETEDIIWSGKRWTRYLYNRPQLLQATINRYGRER